MSESSEGKEYPGFDFPPEYAQCIAKIISYWAALEYSINMAIWHLAGVYPAVGACMTEQIFTLDGRLKSLTSLLKLRRASPDILKRVNKFAEHSHKPRDIRNGIAHDTWYQGTESKRMSQLIIGARGVLTYDYKPIELADLEADCSIVQRAMWQATAIRDSIEIALPTLPEIPLGELHPTWLLSGGNEQTRSSDYRFVLFPPRPSQA